MKMAILLILPLAACVTSREVYLADGSKGHNISCHGAVQSMAACLERAGEMCGPKGYDVVTREGDVVPFSMGGGSIQADRNYASGGYYQQSGAMVSRNLFVKCK